MKKLINYFLQGVLYTAPIAITVFIIIQLFYLIDNILNDPIRKLLNIDFPGFGMLLMIILLVFIGMLGQSIIANPFKKLFKKTIEKTPFLRLIYSIINDLIKGVVGNERKFDKPVLVNINPAANIKKVGFLTRDQLKELDESNTVAVYFPHSYNFSGELFIVPSEQVTPLAIDSTTIMKFVVSGGVLGLKKDTSINTKTKSSL